MNDPGTADPIRQAAEEIDPEFDAPEEAKAQKEEDKDNRQQERDYRDPKYAWQMSFGKTDANCSIKPILVRIHRLPFVSRHVWAHRLGL